MPGKKSSGKSINIFQGTTPMKSFNFSRFLIILAVLFATGSLISQTAFARKKSRLFTSNPIIAKVGSTVFTIEDIEDKQINDLRAQLHEQLTKQLRVLALANLAKKYPEYGKKPKINISEGAKKKFYKDQQLSKRGTYESLAQQIGAYLKMLAISEHNDKLYQRAINEGLIVSYLEKPNGFLVRVPIETAYLWGSKKESVMVLEFSDYQCPFCSRVQPTLTKLRKAFKGRVIFGYRHSPLSFHREADEAAIAVECARDQGGFDAYHKILFGNTRNLNIADLKKYAKQAQLKDTNRFNSCLDTEKYRKRLNNDLKASSAAGIRGTPGFVIGKYDRKRGVVVGEILSGAQPEHAFSAAIAKYLK